MTHLDAAGQPVEYLSNPVELRTAVIRSPATIEFLRIGGIPSGGDSIPAAACEQGGDFVDSGLPLLESGAALSGLAAASTHNLGDPLVLRLRDPDQNIDYQQVDTADVTVSSPDSGDSLRVRLLETAANSGVFVGYLPSAAGPALPDCILQASSRHRGIADYTDPEDSSDSAQSALGFDPSGRTFDSRSGAALDGVVLTLLNAASGTQATVFGSDGSSTFPAQIVSGEVAVDSGGVRYDPGPGGFRFPRVPAGEYRVEITPAAGYVAPSAATAAELNTLAGAPFAVSAASYGQSFNHPADGPLVVDVPLDPERVSLFVQKSSRGVSAAPGDAVPFEVTISNTSRTEFLRDIELTDVPPRELRYVAGSGTLNGAAIADPRRQGDGSLLFDLDGLDPGGTARLSYLMEIVAGADGQIVTNRASAAAPGGHRSNEAAASLQLTEDLFRSSSHVVGRVVEGSCQLDGFDEDRGVAGIRIYLEDGRYAVTDEGGRFHFEGLSPGTHVVQLDTTTVPDYFDVTGCSDQARFAGRGDSQLVDLTAGALSQVGFYLQRKAPPEGNVNLTLVNRGTAERDRVEYAVAVSGRGDVEIEKLDVQIVLPDGVNYRMGSLRLDGQPLPDPERDGQYLTVRLGSQPGEWSRSLELDADIDPDSTGELVTRAVARFSHAGDHRGKTPVAETMIRRESATWENEGYVLGLEFAVLSDDLSADDKATLDRLVDGWRDVRDVRISAVGHSDSTPVSARSQHLFADNYVLSQARARSAAHYLATALGVPEDSISVEGRGPDDPVADNATAAGRQQNRRVELVLAGQRPGRQSFIEIPRQSSGEQVAATRGAIPGTAPGAGEAAGTSRLAAHLAPPAQAEPAFDAVQPGVGWLLPSENYRPPIPALQISIRHEIGQSVALFVNGVEVNAANFAGRDSDPTRNLVVSRWAGVELLEGNNQLVADIVGRDGLIAERLLRQVHYAGAPVRAELVPEQSRLVADGRSRPRIALRLLDRFGQPARHASVGAFAVDAPYRSWWEVDDSRRNRLAEIGNREPLYTVGDEGIAYIELEPTTDSGQVVLRLPFAGQREQEIRAWLEPAARDWILVGFAEGTVGYRTLSQNASPSDHEAGYYDDGRVAFFAKGRVRGEFLLTLAYDSERDRRLSRDRFQGAGIDPDAWYTLYADSSETRFEAQSQRKLYVKLERRQFKALFGDFSTGLSTTELARYERRLNGVHSEFRGENLSYQAFASDNEQNFVRDELAGNGTSGLYRLSAAPLIVQSETVRIEVRDRFDPAIVVDSRTLTRFLDYDIDPYRGTLYFKQPVQSRDAQFNPVIIVVEYETRDGVAGDITGGGRVAVHDGDRRLEGGVTWVSDTEAAGRATLTAIDAHWQVSDGTRLRAEVGSTSSVEAGNRETGQATFFAVEHQADDLQVNAEYRDIDQVYGLGQQSAAERGIRKLALEARYDVSPSVALRSRASKLENHETGAERIAAEGSVEYRSERSSASLGLTHAEDRFLDGERFRSSILDVGASRRLYDSSLSVRANGSFGVDGELDNPDYLSSYVFGADMEVRPEVDLFVEYENAEGRLVNSETTRVGVRSSPWSRAQLTGSVNNESSEFGPRVFANVGLIQGFQLTERWVVDLGLDQSSTLRGDAYRAFDEDRPSAFGSDTDDFVAGFVGTLYQSDDWSMNSRIEYRRSDSDERTTLMSGWFREPGRGHAMSAGLTLFDARGDDGSGSTAAELRVGWALRRADSPWALLYRGDLRHEARRGDIEDRTWRIISNLNANRRLGAASQLGLQYAVKYVLTRFGAVDFDGVTDLYGLDYRRGFGQQFELGLHGSALHSWRADTVDYGAGISVGYNIADDVWISAGFNLKGFHDDDFAASRYTAAGPFLRVTMRGHQSQLKRLTGR